MGDEDFKMHRLVFLLPEIDLRSSQIRGMLKNDTNREAKQRESDSRGLILDWWGCNFDWFMVHKLNVSFNGLEDEFQALMVE